MRELMVMDRFFGGLKSNHRERMSFKELKSLKDLVKGNCAAMLNEVKLEKRNEEFINAKSANSNSQALSETKKKKRGIKISRTREPKVIKQPSTTKKKEKTEETR
jgi:hypothetical protein